MDSYDMPWKSFVSMMQWDSEKALEAEQNGLIPIKVVNGVKMTTSYQYRYYLNNKPSRPSVSYRTSTDL